MEQAPLARINEATIKEHDGIAVCIWLTFSGTKCGTRVLIDSGAGISLIPLSVYNEMTLRPPLQRSDRRINGANAAPIDCYGMITLDVVIERVTCTHKFYVCEDSVSPLIGREFMHKHDIAIRPAYNEVYLRGKPIPGYDMRGMKVSNRVALVNTITLKPGEEVQLSAKIEGRGDPDGITCYVEPAKTFFLRTGAMVARTVTIPKRRNCQVRMFNPNTEPVRLWRGMTMGILKQAEQTRPYDSDSSPDDDDRDQLPARGPFVDEVAVVSTTTPHDAIAEDMANVALKKKPIQQTLPPYLQDLFDRSTGELNKEQSKRLHDLLCTYQDAFSRDSNDIGLTHWVKHDVDTGQEEPVRQRPRRLRYEQRPVLQKTIADLQKQGRIRPSTSEWASNVVLVKKKQEDLTKPAEWRMCIDYRELNLKTKNPDSYMLPRIDDTLDSLSRARFFCTLDIQQGYHNVELTERAKQKSAFHVPCVNPPHWEWVYMPFGLVGAPRTFQRLMDRMLQGLEHKIALAYIDDVIVYGASVDEVLQNLDTVFERILAAGVKLKTKKCHLFKRETTYLGHVISAEGVKCEQRKVQAVQAWHAPKTVKTLRSFLGMVCYYSKFIPNFAAVSMPLYSLLKGRPKNKDITWGKPQQQAFETLKTALVTAPILAYPEPHGTYILDTDASNFAYGAVLSQLQPAADGQLVERVIAYHSKILNSAEQRYCARRRELLAIVRAVKYFEVYLRGPKFIIRTDHASLQYIKTLTTMPDQMYRWILTLEQYDYVIQVRPGKDHTNADTLSRVPCAGKICICEQVEEYELRAKTKVGTVTAEGEDALNSRYKAVVNVINFQPKWSNEDMRRRQQTDLDIGPVYKAFAADPKTRPRWEHYSAESPACKAYFAEWKRLHMHNGILYRRWENPAGTITRMQMIIPRALQQTICEQVHDGRTTAHLGKRRALRLLIKTVHWFKMDYDVNWWIKTCSTCQRRKKPKKPPQAPIRSTPAGHVNERVAMDIVGPIKKTQAGNVYVLCITDHFTKYSRAYALPDQKATTIAKVFVENWVHIFGHPLQVHTDQGANFESDVMHEVCRLYGIDKTRTTAYHPQGNAQNERYNQTIINIVAMLVDKDEYDNWDEQLPIAVAAYNATEHSTTGYTPNMLQLHREIPHQLDRMLPDGERNEEETWDDYVRGLDKSSKIAYDAARQAIGKAVKIQKRYYDRKQNLHAYNTGDAVLMKDHTQRETNTKKLADKYKGPYFVIDALSDIHFRVARDRDDRPKIVHHDNIKPMHLRQPVDLRWVYDLSRLGEKNAAPATVEDMGKSVSDLLRRLKCVEHQLGDERRVTGRRGRKRKQPEKPQQDDQATPKANDQQPSVDSSDAPKQDVPTHGPLAADTTPISETNSSPKPRQQTVSKKLKPSKLPKPAKTRPRQASTQPVDTPKPSVKDSIGKTNRSKKSILPVKTKKPVKPTLSLKEKPTLRRSSRPRKPKIP